MNIVERMDKNAVEIWLHERSGNKVINYSTDGANLIGTTLDPCQITDDLAPLLSLPRHMAQPMIDALVEFNSKIGRRSENENLLQGKLAATTEHLTDMRDMAKKLLESVINNQKSEQ